MSFSEKSAVLSLKVILIGNEDTLIRLAADESKVTAGLVESHVILSVDAAVFKLPALSAAIS
jgi:hypothetical protein